MPGHNYPSKWQRTRQRILKRDHHRCGWCDEPATTVDHVVPIDVARRNGWSEAEIHHDSNLVAACTSCNYSRSNRLGPPKTKTKTKSETRARFFKKTPTTSPQVGSYLSPNLSNQGTLWDLSERAD